MERYVKEKADISDVGDVLPEVSGCTVLREEREKRRMSRKELGEIAELSETWIRDIEIEGKNPGVDARERIRRALEQCPIHRDFKIDCAHRLPVPADDKLYSKK